MINRYPTRPARPGGLGFDRNSRLLQLLRADHSGARQRPCQRQKRHQTLALTGDGFHTDEISCTVKRANFSSFRVLLLHQMSSTADFCLTAAIWSSLFITSAPDKMPFEVTPFFPRLSRYGANGTPSAASAQTASSASAANATN